MRRPRLALLLPALALCACLGLVGTLLAWNRDAARTLARQDAHDLAREARELASDHLRLYAAVLEVRAGALPVTLRRDHAAFAAYAQQLRARSEGTAFAQLPGLAETLDATTAFTSRIDTLLAAAGTDPAPAAVVQELARGLPSLRDPLAEMVRTVNAAQALAQAERQRVLAGMQARALAGLGLLALATLVGALLLLGTMRQLARARLAQLRLSTRTGELADDAEQAVQGRRKMLALVAGEIHARVSGVTGTLGRAQETRDLDARARDALGSVRAQAEDLLMLATDLSDLARLETGEVRLHPAPFRLHDALDQAGDLLRHRFHGPAGGVAVQLAETTPDWWLGDAARIRQLLHHLGAVAIDAAAGGRTVISAEAEPDPSGGEGARVLVLRATAHPPSTALLSGASAPGGAAQGAGQQAAGQQATPIQAAPIQAGTPQEGVLHRAGQAKRPAPQGAPGSGRVPSSLALTLAETLSTAMGGRLAVVPEAGATQFTLRLNLALAEAPPPQPEAAPRTGPLDILVVDDVALNRRLLGAVLERFGHRCAMAADGLEALSVLQQRRFDLVLMDVQMPNLDGMAATRMVRALPPPAGLVPVIAVTAAVLPAERQACIAAGMDGFLAKPVATADLLAAIAAATSQRQVPGLGAAQASDAAVGPLMDTQTQAILRSTLTPEEFTRLAAATESEAQAGLRALDAAAAAADAAAMAEAAAGMAALCEGIGGLRVVAIARALEAASQAGEGATRAAAHLPALRRALGETLAALNRMAPAARDASSSAVLPPPTA
jgi:CheY-like chemotaxis protein